MLSVALIGSSGGGTATLGHTDAAELLRIIHAELQKTKDCSGLTSALFCSLHGGKGFDAAKVEADTATLYNIVDIDCVIQPIKTGLLKDVNKQCAALDRVIACAIRRGEIHGLICISCHTEIHKATLEAAASMKIPVTGSGGTSLSAAASQYGIQLVGNAGGSVATTSYTRAVSYTNALASSWKKAYRPFSSDDSIQVPQWTSILNACLPAFWAVMLVCRLVDTVSPFLDDSTWIRNHVLLPLQKHALPTVCSVIMATSLAPQHESTAIMAAAIASVTCSESILAGLVAGFMVANLLGRVLFQCVIWNIPATMTNLMVAGGIGGVVASTVAFFTPFLQQTTEFIRYMIHVSMNGEYPGVGFVIGAAFCWGSKVGYYHALCLPIILVEMELGKPSLWGAIDEATLVLVSAGICSANLILPANDHTRETRELCRRGLRINLMYGDFIEVAYPFTEKSTLVNFAAYLASGISTELMTGSSSDVLSSAYLPLPLCIWLAKDRSKLALAYVAAFFVSFVVTVVNNISTRLGQRGTKSE